MKKLLLFIGLILLFSSTLIAQVGINPDGSAPDASAALDIAYTTKGFLLPRMTFEQRNAIPDPVEGLMVYCTNCKADGSGALSIYQGGIWLNYAFACDLPVTPTEGMHESWLTNITWTWYPVPIATGYLWNTVDDYSTAIDVGISIYFNEPDLPCGTSYVRYVWAYNACGISAPVTLSQSSVDCWTCGSSLTINHESGSVAPVTKTVIYGTVTNIPGETSKCWITSNLGADHQASAKNDPTEPSAGWYWQFNKQQGYMHDGTTRTPNYTWINWISENSDWLAANDPCTLELGNGWHVPTYTEWVNVFVNGNWVDWNGPWNSALKMHAAGGLFYGNGSLQNRGTYGMYFSSSQFDNQTGWYLIFGNAFCSTDYFYKTEAYTIRCLRD